MAEQTVELAPEESKVVTFEATPHEAKTYQVTVDGLSGSFRSLAVPDIKLTKLTWDATPPFEPGSRHHWRLTMQNLAVGRLTYQLWMSMNGKRFMGYTADLAAGAVKEINYPYTFGIEGSYTLSIEAYYQDKLLDEISSTVIVEVPPAPPVIDGRIVGGYVCWKEAGQWQPWVPIGYTNTWPAATEILARISAENTGNVAANFRIFLGAYSNTIRLAPGERGEFEITFNTMPTPGTYNWGYSLYANGKEVDKHIIKVTVY